MRSLHGRVRALTGWRIAGFLPAGTISYAWCKVIPGAAGFGGVLLFIRIAGTGAYGV
jgi:hypothetical protein